MVHCFKSLDLDNNNLISRRDVELSMGSLDLADIFLSTFTPTKDPLGVSWIEWSASGEDAIGMAWEALLSGVIALEERIDRGVMILQRYTAEPWLELNGRERGHHRTPTVEDNLCGVGIGVLLLVEEEGRPFVSKVCRPGPSDEKLYGGDVIFEVDGLDLHGMPPGEAVCRILGFIGDAKTGPVTLGVKRNSEVAYETVYRKVAPPKVRLSCSLAECSHHNIS